MVEEWTTEEDATLRRPVAQHGTKKWATIAVAAAFGHDSTACERRWRGFLNPQHDSFAFGGASRGGAVEGHALIDTAKAGGGFGVAYYGLYPTPTAL